MEFSFTDVFVFVFGKNRTWNKKVWKRKRNDWDPGRSREEREKIRFEKEETETLGNAPVDCKIQRSKQNKMAGRKKNPN